MHNLLAQIFKRYDANVKHGLTYFFQPFAWKAFFEEAANMGMRIDIIALART